MNTVFKVYFQVWTLLAVATGYAICRLIPAGVPWARGASRGWRAPASGVLALLLLASLAYPLAAGRSRTGGFAERRGLDGIAALRVEHPEEWAGIRWLHDTVPVGTVVAEAPGCAYGELGTLPHNRVSAFAGTSTPLGWDWLEFQWRAGTPALLAALETRRDDVNTLYNTTDPGEAARILDRYGIEYVYIGLFERAGYVIGGRGTECRAGGAYAEAGLAKFGALMEQVFVSEGALVAIYRRR